MILGGGPPVETLETTLYGKIRAGGSGSGRCESLCRLAADPDSRAVDICFAGSGADRLDSGRASRKAQSFVAEARGFPGYPRGGNFCRALSRSFCAFLFFSSCFGRNARGNSSGSSDFVWFGRVTSVLAVVLALLGVWAETRSRFFAQIGSLALVAPSGISVMVLGLGFFIAFASVSGSVFGLRLADRAFFRRFFSFRSHFAFFSRSEESATSRHGKRREPWGRRRFRRFVGSSGPAGGGAVISVLGVGGRRRVR